MDVRCPLCHASETNGLIRHLTKECPGVEPVPGDRIPTVETATGPRGDTTQAMPAESVAIDIDTLAPYAYPIEHLQGEVKKMGDEISNTERLIARSQADIEWSLEGVKMRRFGLKQLQDALRLMQDAQAVALGTKKPEEVYGRSKPKVKRRPRNRKSA